MPQQNQQVTCIPSCLKLPSFVTFITLAYLIQRSERIEPVDSVARSMITEIGGCGWRGHGVRDTVKGVEEESKKHC